VASHPKTIESADGSARSDDADGLITCHDGDKQARQPAHWPSDAVASHPKTIESADGSARSDDADGLITCHDGDKQA
ncbi:hypothetical protein QBT27_21105, partial [Cronobacter sakazakii]|nr:hypothetical protein [Cronobacter sakazakii]